MSLQQILQAMEEEAAQEEHRFLAESRSAADRMLADAEEHAAAVRRTLQERAVAVVREAERRAEADAELGLAARRAEDRRSRIQRVFMLAEGRLQVARSDDVYPAAVAALLFEALEAVPSDWPVVARCDPRDLPLVARAAREAGRFVAVDASLNTIGGVVVEDVHGRVTVDNSLESRLDRGRERLRSAVVALLAPWEGQELPMRVAGTVEPDGVGPG